ncbi:MAG: hypothetical protein JO212_21595, partial [Acetobacteraceae bacterium]|nr:hypothetical protein [Acetobacteraceae bacterium]
MQAALAARAPALWRGPDLPVFTAALALLLATAVPLAQTASWNSVGLLGVAATLGWAFLAINFGYTGAVRAWLTRGDGSGLAAGLI